MTEQMCPRDRRSATMAGIFYTTSLTDRDKVENWHLLPLKTFNIVKIHIQDNLTSAYKVQLCRTP